ncbi:FapA family protein [Bacillus sp. JJ1503]|uniref:FapA family protein n=1 Tax=Bacillus sp. JJ1503 TaxID=3122956 RepID=UPI003000ED11
MTSIISKGKDLNEAINLGLELLGATRDEVDLEIIQNDSKGFLGIASKKAIVKLTKNQRTPSTSNLNEFIENLESNIPIEMFDKGKENFLDDYLNQAEFKQTDTEISDGKVWLKNGKLYCKSSPTHFPMVTINNGIKLFKNNELVNEKTTIITEKDLYEIRVENEEKETVWEITVDQQKLNVQLSLEPGYKILRTVPDMDVDDHIELNVLEKKEVNNTLNFLDVVNKLEEIGVKQGINQDEILRAIESTEPGIFIIASGEEPKPGKHGWIELQVETETFEGPKENEDGRVDFREIKIIPKVERGKVIAVVHSPIPGKMGYTVLNEPIPAKQTLPIVLNIGRGVIVVEDKIVATESGRPRVEQRGQLVKVSIVPKLQHMGNVDLASGNIRFKGDVEISGEVEERMVVEAEGDIITHKTVNEATLTSSGSIISYGNIISSEISAGKNNMLVTELGHLLGNIHQSVEKIIALITQLTHSPAFKSSDFSRGGLQPLIRILLERKFKNFPPLVKKYVDAVRMGEGFLEDEEWKMTAVSLSNLFLSLTNEVVSVEPIIQLSKKMKNLHESSKTTVDSDSFITIPSAMNSRLYSSGNILILGQGCVNTKIHAGGILKISGILRGGEVYGRLGVEVNEVGSMSGLATIISVPKDKKIYINKALEGTILKIENVKRTVKETTYHICAYLDENGHIVFE